VYLLAKRIFTENYLFKIFLSLFLTTALGVGEIKTPKASDK